jgi:hypothetical protein
MPERYSEASISFSEGVPEDTSLRTVEKDNRQGDVMQESIDGLCEEIFDRNQKGLKMRPVSFGDVTVSIQAGSGRYSTPSSNEAKRFTAVEIKSSNQRPPDYIMPYAQDPENPTKTTYEYVPIELVVRWAMEESVVNTHPEPEQKISERKEGVSLSIEEAREAIGRENFIGPEDIEPLLQIDLEQVPAIPYSEDELRKAKSEGFMLVLRMDTDKDGKKLTGARLNKVLQARMPRGSVLLSDADGSWYRDEQFYIDETCKAEWKLITSQCVPNSFRQNYSDQTRTLRDMAKARGVLTAEAEAECTDAVLDELAQMALSDETWQEAAKRLTELKVNKNHRPKFVESLWDKAFTSIIHRRKDLESTNTWTSSLSSSGRLVSCGHGPGNGGKVYNWEPKRWSEELGAKFSV